MESTFNFKQFKIIQSDEVHKVGTDGVLLGAWTSMSKENKILDVGTGTGLIALMASQRTGAMVTALEPHLESFRLALNNVLNSPWSERIKVLETSIQDFSTSEQFDLIISNPPFFSNSLLPPTDARKIHRHTKSLTLKDLIDSAARLLQPHGKLSVVLPVLEAHQFLLLAEERKLFPTRITQVRSKKLKPVERLMMELGFEALSTKNDEVILLNEQGFKTEEYSRITQDFYL